MDKLEEVKEHLLNKIKSDNDYANADDAIKYATAYELLTRNNQMSGLGDFLKQLEDLK